MNNSVIIDPPKNELPSQYCDRLGSLYSKAVTQDHKKKNGQFFTPLEIAKFMASLSTKMLNTVRILDPGCGLGILSCALIENIVKTDPDLSEIELDVYENDISIEPFLRASMNYLEKWLNQNNIKCRINIIPDDFILQNSRYLDDNSDLFGENIPVYDIIISNPPYFKLSIQDSRAKAAKIVVNGHPNIYAIFMAVAAKLLKREGELIFITPRSYSSGYYFKVFRNYFFKLIDLDMVHLFVSRTDTFNRDKVLQETVIIKGTRRKIPKEKIQISSSNGLADILSSNVKSYRKQDIINRESGEKILYLPTSDYEENILKIFKSWNGTLGKYNIKISTGPVVSFRAWDLIKKNGNESPEITTPLFWLHNIKQMQIEWPVNKGEKGQFILVNEKSKPILIPNKNYVLLRRFSSKDDKNRLIAAPYFSEQTNSEYIGVENKLNYIYRPNGILSKNEIIGLSAILNSAIFDSFFRIFNGNVNVSATELRNMTFPPLDLIIRIGSELISSKDYSVNNINQIITSYLETDESYGESRRSSKDFKRVGIA